MTKIRRYTRKNETYIVNLTRTGAIEKKLY